DPLRRESGAAGELAGVGLSRDRGGLPVGALHREPRGGGAGAGGAAKRGGGGGAAEQRGGDPGGDSVVGVLSVGTPGCDLARGAVAGRVWRGERVQLGCER